MTTTKALGLTAPMGDTPALDRSPDGEEMTFTAVFPLTDAGLDMTKDELVREAENGQLADLLWENNAVLVGYPMWRIDTAEDNTMYLTVEAPARRWDDNVRYRARDYVKPGRAA